MEIISEQVKKFIGNKEILKGINIDVKNKEFLGIIGPNGSGKSTFLKCIYRILKPSEGKILFNGKNIDELSFRQTALDLAVVAQHNFYNFDFKVLDVVLMGRSPHKKILERDNEIDYKIARNALEKVGLKDFVERNFTTLSGGEQQRVILARALTQETECLVLDEPTNHLDTKMADWLEDYLRRYRGAMIMVTHDRYFLDQVTNRIKELDHASLYSYETNYSGYLQKKAEREQNEDSAAAKRKNLLRTELEWLNRGARARSTKQKAHIQRIENLQEQRGPVRDRTVQLDSVASRLGKTTLEVEGLAGG